MYIQQSLMNSKAASEPQYALVSGWCQSEPESFFDLISCSGFSCKSAYFRSGPDETRTRDLRHAKAAKQFLMRPNV
jgi:hypothetical protein